MKLLSTLISLFIINSLIAQQIPAFPEGAEKLNNKLLAGINSRHINWAKQEAGKINSKQLEASQASTAAGSYGKLARLGEGDIEALTFITLMQAAKSAQEDVKGVMQSVKAINATKAKMREVEEQRKKLAGNEDVAKLEAGGSGNVLDGASITEGEGSRAGSGGNKKLNKKTLDSLYRAIGLKSNITQFKVSNLRELNTQIEQIKKDIDAMSEMGEMESLRLQMAMDRASKMMSTLSNLQKKISDSADSIIKNLK